MIESYPTTDDPFLKAGSEQAAQEISLLKEVVMAIRNIRGENRISPAIKISVFIATEDHKSLEC